SRLGPWAVGWIGLRASVAWAAPQSPSIDVLGSYFPAWLVCIVAGVFLMLITRLLFAAWKIHPYLLFPPLVYSCLTPVFAMTVWLIFFGTEARSDRTVPEANPGKEDPPAPPPPAQVKEPPRPAREPAGRKVLGKIISVVIIGLAMALALGVWGIIEEN